VQLLYPKPLFANILEIEISIGVERHDSRSDRREVAVYKPDFNVNISSTAL